MITFSPNNNENSEFSNLPRGSLVHRVIRGKDRFYHQWRENGKTLSRYLKPDEVLPLRQQLERRREIELSLLKSEDTGSRTPKTAAETSSPSRILAELAYGVRKLVSRREVGKILAFLRGGNETRLLILSGPPLSGRTTILRQVLGQLSESELKQIKRAEFIDTARLGICDFTALQPKRDLTDFIEGGGLLSDIFTSAKSARTYVESLVGEGSWEDLEPAAADLLLRALRHRSGARHIRSRASTDIQRLMHELEKRSRNALHEEERVKTLSESGLLTSAAVDVLRPEFRIQNDTLFNQPGLAFTRVREMIDELLDGVVFADLGAAERKLVRDTILQDLREQILEDAVYLETLEKRAADDVSVIRLECAPRRLAFLICDRNELTCELYEVRNTEVRHERQLANLLDPRLLAIVEHRYGTIAERTVLYKGRDARDDSGVSYRNLVKFLG